ncbi:Cytosolic carboxypeptidase 1 [Dirofilaria immitis]|nr:Cytosolic carboxypeptidase 1 [Dirofilaria immitis]
MSSRSSNEYLVKLLKAIEVCRNELTTSFFCRLLLGFITCCKPSASLVRQHRIIRLDGTNSLIRCFVSYIANLVHCSSIDMLCSLLIMLYVRERNREHLIAIGAVETFNSAISLINNDKEYLDDGSSVESSVMILKKSLLALCMSCLPLHPFPISSSTPPPITFPLPREICNEDAGDDEDEALFAVTVDGDIEEDNSHLHPISVNFHQHLSLHQLTDNYLHYFIEFFQGTTMIDTSSMTTSSDKSGMGSFADLVAKTKIRSPLVFVKIAYPTTILPTNLHSVLQPLDLLIRDIAHLQSDSSFSARVVYDLDYLISDKTQIPASWKTIGNDDENRIGKMDSKNHLLFESRFEGGNLRRAIQVNKWYYQLILSPDINELRPHFQWFFFEVSNNETGVDYVYAASIVLSHRCLSRNPKWVRVGSAATLERYLSKNGKEGQIYVRNDQLCTSLAGNTVSLITVTANGTKEQLFDREIILLSARVHPGENNTSWIMHGIMDFLMSDTEEAMELRDRFVFKLIPMLNVDGVVNGSHRCSLAGVDLNRTWDKPSRLLHPAIYHSKAIIQYIVGKNHFMSLPLLLQQTCDYFSLSNCRFNITKTKESSGRITLWRQFGITRSYTLESTYCGFNCGSLKGYQVNIEHLMDMGKQLCKTFSYLKNDNPSDQQEDDDDDDSE